MIKLHSDFVEKLPGDLNFDNYPRQVSDACYSYVLPTSASNPKLVAFSEKSAGLIDLPPEECMTSNFIEIMSGNYLPAGTKPYAMCYGGHQFII